MKSIFFVKKIRIKLLFSEKIRHIKNNRWNTGACLCNIGRKKDGLRPKAPTSARASGGQFTNKWMPIVFGCHCRPDRSFFWKGKQFPVCARCTWEAVGMLICIPLFLVWRPDIRISFALMIPMLIDGFTQKLTSYESTNFRRFVTGFLFGIGLVGIIADTTIFCFSSGVEYGKALKNRR